MQPRGFPYKSEMLHHKHFSVIETKGKREEGEGTPLLYPMKKVKTQVCKVSMNRVY